MTEKKQHLAKALEKLTSKRKPADKKPLSKPVPQMFLDQWPNAVRGVPNVILRGSLFSVSQRRAAVKDELLTVVDGIEIRFTGYRFNQTDLDLWEMLVHLARSQPLGNTVEFTANSILKALGRSTGRTQHRQLHEELLRLRSGTTDITVKGKKGFFGGLIQNGKRDIETGRYVIQLDPDMLKLYEAGYTQVDWAQRQALGNNNLSKWLHGFYSSHAAPFPYKVATLKELCGSTSKDLRDFRRMLKKSLEDLVAVGCLEAWEVSERDLVSVTKIPTMSQQRHIEKRSK